MVDRRLKSDDVLHALSELFAKLGAPEHLRSDNGPEFTAKVVRHWLKRVGVQTLFIEPGSPWENGYNESFNGKLKDELVDREIFYSLREAQVLLEQWRRAYNTIRRTVLWATGRPPRRRSGPRRCGSGSPCSGARDLPPD